jgi:GDP-D-mannose dehydratase
MSEPIQNIFELTAEITKIGNRAVYKAQEENRQKGIPNVYAKKGQIYYQLPDGRITTKKAGIDEKIMAKHLNASTAQQSNSSTSKPINFSTLTEGQPLIEVDSQYFRPTEVEMLLGDPARAKEKLGWEAEFSINQLVKDMVDSDFEVITNDK